MDLLLAYWERDQRTNDIQLYSDMYTVINNKWQNGGLWWIEEILSSAKFNGMFYLCLKVSWWEPKGINHCMSEKSKSIIERERESKERAKGRI